MTISKINGTIAKCRSVQLSRNNDSVYQTEVYFSIMAKLEMTKNIFSKCENVLTFDMEKLLPFVWKNFCCSFVNIFLLAFFPKIKDKHCQGISKWLKKPY